MLCCAKGTVDMKHKITRIAIALLMSLLVMTSVSVDMTYAADDTVSADVTYVTADTENAENVENATKVPVLTYHAVGPRDQGKLQVSVYKFKKQVDWIKKCGYTTLTMEEFVEWYEGKRTIPEKSVLITFDDGNKCVVKYAVPILKKNKQHATMFVVGNWIGRYSLMANKSTIRKLQKSSVIDIESHGYALHDRDHRRMPAHKWSKEKLKRDCEKMNEMYDCTVLCYPWGATSKNLRQALEETGVYRVAFTYARLGQYQGAKSKYARRSDKKYAIPRITVSGRESWTAIKKWIKK